MARTIGRYEIREQLGRGGMSTVYLATDTRLDREVALKLMDQQLMDDPSFAVRFEREAKTVAGLEHNAIVSLYDFGETGGWLYLVMRYMKGGTLKERISRGPMTTRQAYNVVRRVGSALDKAHSRGIVHRDLKPANILLDEDQQPYLSDFGIVKVAKGDAEYLTQTGQTLGTFAYMSPEQVMGKELDGRSDIYALGIILYEMLTGKHPYAEFAGRDSAMAVAHAKEPIPNIIEDNRDLPVVFTRILQKALAKDPGDRYATGREMALAIYNALTGKPEAVVKPKAAEVKPEAAGEKVRATPPKSKPEPQPPARQPDAQQPIHKPEAEQPAWMPKPRSQVQPQPVREKTESAPFPRWLLFLEGVLTILLGIFLILGVL